MIYLVVLLLVDGEPDEKYPKGVRADSTVLFDLMYEATPEGYAAGREM